MATTLETGAVLGLKQIIHVLGHRALGINFSNANPNTYTMTETIVIAPLKEEFLCRGILKDTGEFLDRKGHATAAARFKNTTDIFFGLAHSELVFRTKSGKLRPNLHITRHDHSFPVTPYIGSRHYSRLAKQRGLGHALYGHALNNSVSFLQKPKMTSEAASCA